MKLLYVAGPYRDKRGAYYISKNIQAAAEIAIKLWNMGFAVICPHKNTALYDGVIPDEDILKGDLEMLSRCDMVVMMPGWSESVGATRELTYAQEHDIPVTYWYENLDTLSLGGFDLS